MKNKICPKCRGLMERGLISPNNRWWINKSKYFSNLKKLENLLPFFKRRFDKLEFYACTKCGYIEAYVAKRKE